MDVAFSTTPMVKLDAPLFLHYGTLPVLYRSWLLHATLTHMTSRVRMVYWNVRGLNDDNDEGF